ncbi:MAG: phosphopentomutase [Candidatus Melainabacteria bacterium]|nr:phosphopentomutase [Candidatus Melainabacteria bacterium]
MKKLKKRAIIFIIDALGIGSMPDFKEFEEEKESNTFTSTVLHSLKSKKEINIPTLRKLGLGNISPLEGFSPEAKTTASFGKMAELNKAKDTITGHWEMAGIKTTNVFPYYPNGFPPEIIEKLKTAFNVKGILCNLPYSGTELLKDYGEEHIKTGYPIIYTSADSVLQIATHSSVVPLETLYQWCKAAREIMRGEHEVARIIARPFTDNPDKNSELKFIRQNDKRHDYAVLPHGKSILETLGEKDIPVIGFGKIQDIFAGVGVPFNIHTKNNIDGLEKLTDILKGNYTNHESELISSSSFSGTGVKNINQILNSEKELLFINLVETDANYGHRRDPDGFAKALEDIDTRLTKILELLTEDDLLLISADHGCDPTAAGTDHTREYVPLLLYTQGLIPKDLGTRNSFADIGASILKWFEIEDSEIPIQGEACV